MSNQKPITKVVVAVAVAGVTACAGNGVPGENANEEAYCDTNENDAGVSSADGGKVLRVVDTCVRPSPVRPAGTVDRPIIAN